MSIKPLFCIFGSLCSETAYHSISACVRMPLAILHSNQANSICLQNYRVLSPLMWIKHVRGSRKITFLPGSLTWTFDPLLARSLYNNIWGGIPQIKIILITLQLQPLLSSCSDMFSKLPVFFVS